MLFGELSSAEFFAERGGDFCEPDLFRRLECLALGPQSGDLEPVLLNVPLVLLVSRPTHFLLEVSSPSLPACPLSLNLALFTCGIDL